MQGTQEMRVRSLVQEDPLEKGMAAHSSILAGRIPWTEEPGGLQSTGSQRDTTEQLSTHAHRQRVYKLKFLSGNLARDTDLDDFKI